MTTSTGPKTTAGKAISSRNAQVHGLTSKLTILPHEDESKYLQLLTDLTAKYQPADSHETLLVERVADTMWRMQRCYSVETNFLQHRINAAIEENPELHPEAAMAMVFIEKDDCSRMRLLMRYITTAERAYRQAVKDLEQTQYDRYQREANAEAQAEENIDTDSVEFVSHNPTPGRMSQLVKASLPFLPKLNLSENERSAA